MKGVARISVGCYKCVSGSPGRTAGEACPDGYNEKDHQKQYSHVKPRAETESREPAFWIEPGRDITESINDSLLTFLVGVPVFVLVT